MLDCLFIFWNFVLIYKKTERKSDLQTIAYVGCALTIAYMCIDLQIN